MNRKRTHTWEMFLEYLQCPSCGFIIENRDPYQDRFGVLEKEIQCERCQKTFKHTKQATPTFGPLIGKPQPLEAEWREPEK